MEDVKKKNHHRTVKPETRFRKLLEEKKIRSNAEFQRMMADATGNYVNKGRLSRLINGVQRDMLMSTGADICTTLDITMDKLAEVIGIDLKKTA